MSRPTAGERVYPERITIALDARGLYGPEVDAALGVPEPTVDEWEAGLYPPTREQLKRLADLTEYPVKFFLSQPVPFDGATFVCGANGCTATYPDWPDTRHEDARTVALGLLARSHPDEFRFLLRGALANPVRDGLPLADAEEDA